MYTHKLDFNINSNLCRQETCLPEVEEVSKSICLTICPGNAIHFGIVQIEKTQLYALGSLS